MSAKYVCVWYVCMYSHIVFSMGIKESSKNIKSIWVNLTEGKYIYIYIYIW